MPFKIIRNRSRLKLFSLATKYMMDFVYISTKQLNTAKLTMLTRSVITGTFSVVRQSFALFLSFVDLFFVSDVSVVRKFYST